MTLGLRKVKKLQVCVLKCITNQIKKDNNFSTKSSKPYLLVLVKNELAAFSESLGPPLSRSRPIMAIVDL